MNKRRLIFLLIAVLLFGSIAFGALALFGRLASLSDKGREAIMLDNILNNLVLPPGLDKKLTVQEKRNQVFAALTRINPILGLEGVDLDALGKSASGLEQSFKALVDSGGWQSEIREDNFQPVEFLKLLPALEQARRQVAETGDGEAIKRYNQLLYQALEAYDKAIDATVEQYQKLENYDMRDQAVAVKPEYSFNFLKTKTDWQTLIQALENLKSQAAARKQEADRRIACLSNGAVCDEIIGGNPTKYLAEAFALGAGDGFSEPITPKLKAEAIVNDYLKSRSYYLKDDKIYGLATACFGDSGYSYFYAAYLQSETAAKLLGISADALPAADLIKPFYLNDAFFVKVDPQRDKRFPYLKPLVDKGYRWHNLVETNYYFCSDLSYQAKLATLEKITKELAQAPLEKLNDKEIDGLKEQIVGAKVVKNENVAKLMQLLDNRLASTSEVYLAKKLGTAELWKIESLLRQFKDNSAGLPELLAAAAFFNRTLPRLNEINEADAKNKVSLVFLYSTHAYPSLFFLPFNRSLIAEPPTFGSAAVEEKNRIYFQLADVLKTYGEQEASALYQVSRHLFQQ